MPFDPVKWAALGGGAAPIFTYAPNDLDARLVAEIFPKLRTRVEQAVAAIEVGENDATLSPLGRAMAAERIAREALTDINDLAAMEAVRKTLQARIDAAPAPTLDAIPAPLAAPLLASLQALDPTMRAPQARGWLAQGDASAATLLVNLPLPLALISESEKADLTEVLRVSLNAPASRRAADLTQVVNAVDVEAKAARAYLASYLPTAVPEIRMVA